MSSSTCGFASLPGGSFQRALRLRVGGRPSFRAQDGQALTEFALVLPLLMLIILGIFKFGVSYNNYLTLTDAVRSGARQLALERGIGGGDPNAPCTDAVGRVQSAAGGLNAANITITVYADYTVGPSDSYTVSGSGAGVGTCDTMTSGDAVKVVATYPCDATIMGIDFAPGCNLTASATERTE